MFKGVEKLLWRGVGDARAHYGGDRPSFRDEPNINKETLIIEKITELA